jgi:uncharacterized protein (DUF2237 family)
MDTMIRALTDGRKWWVCAADWLVEVLQDVAGAVDSDDYHQTQVHVRSAPAQTGCAAAVHL